MALSTPIGLVLLDDEAQKYAMPTQSFRRKAGAAAKD